MGEAIGQSLSIAVGVSLSPIDTPTGQIGFRCIVRPKGDT